MFQKIAIGLVVCVGFANTIIESPEHVQLLTELRCVACGHQSLLDSQHPFAISVKKEIQAQVEQGVPYTIIRKNIKKTYGDTIDFNPNNQHWVLWSLPWILVVLAVAGWRKYA